MSKEDVDEILRQFEKAKVRDHAFDGSCCYNNNEGGQGHPECRYPYNPGRENPSGQQCLKLKEEHFDLRSVLTPLVAQTETGGGALLRKKGIPMPVLPTAEEVEATVTGYLAQKEQKEVVEEECTVEFAREMVKTGHLRGLIECPLHGHHNPYHMSVTGEEIAPTPQEEKEVASGCRRISGVYTYLRHRYDYETGKCTKCGKELGVEAQKEQKEGVVERVLKMTVENQRVYDTLNEEQKECFHINIRNAVEEAVIQHTPTPTVKEESHTPDDGLETRAIHTTGEALEIVNAEKRKIESHTQGWEERFDEQFVPKENQGGLVGALAGPMREYTEELRVFIKEVASQEYQRGALYNHEGTFTRGFEAGRLQGIADAVAVVPQQRSDMFSYGEGAAASGAQDGWNDCRQAMLTALEAIKNKK